MPRFAIPGGGSSRGCWLVAVWAGSCSDGLDVAGSTWWLALWLCASSSVRTCVRIICSREESSTGGDGSASLPVLNVICERDVPGLLEAAVAAWVEGRVERRGVSGSVRRRLFAAFLRVLGPRGIVPSCVSVRKGSSYRRARCESQLLMLVGSILYTL